MIKIKRSVGAGAINHWVDVLEVQGLLNDNLSRLPKASKLLDEDGKCGKKSIEAIKAFQETVMKIKPDGNVGPRGNTLKKLNLHAEKETVVTPCLAHLATKNNIFPFVLAPTKSYKTGMRKFGHRRDGGKRKHAGCDLYAPAGTAIRAMDDGVVMRPVETFYLGTNQLQIRHKDFVARYGEISHLAAGIDNGVAVKRGQVIAYVGTLTFKSGNTMSMLHLELYSGQGTGPLTVRDNVYRRRGDLIDPTEILDAATR